MNQLRAATVAGLADIAIAISYSHMRQLAATHPWSRRWWRRSSVRSLAALPDSYVKEVLAVLVIVTC
jgi:hypothetical protein